MKFGVVFPQTEIGADVGGVREFAQGVQTSASTTCSPTTTCSAPIGSAIPVLTGPYRTEHQFHEILVVFGYIAAVAPELELVTDVDRAAAADGAAREAGGRGRPADEREFRLGLGIGWNFVEYEAFGEDFTNRGRRFEEQIELMRRLWTEPVFDYEGRWHTITAAGINPLPVQRPIPDLDRRLGEPRASARGNPLADGFFPQRPLDGGWPETLAQMRALGRGGGARLVGVRQIEQRIPDCLSGTPDDWRATADEWRELGATHLCSRPWAAHWLGSRAISSGCARRTRCSRDHPGRDRALRRGAHDAADEAARRAPRRDVRNGRVGADDGRASPGQVAGVARLRDRRAPRARDRHVHRLRRPVDGGWPRARRSRRHVRARTRSGPRSPSGTSSGASTPTGSPSTSGPRSRRSRSLDGEFDFVFIDADKGGYVDYFEAVLPRLSERGLIAVDNTLSGGHVLEDDPKETSAAIKVFNEYVRADDRVISVLLTVRDGVTLIRRR